MANFELSGCFSPQRQVEEIEAGYASREDPDLCACNGSGWILSSWDTWHRCPLHEAVGHPEDGDYGDE